MKQSALIKWATLILLCLETGCESTGTVKSKMARTKPLSVDKSRSIRDFALTHIAQIQVPRYSATGLFNCIERDDIAQVKMLLKASISPNSRRETERPALHDAIGLGRNAIARSLIDFGADVNLRDADGNTPLMEAAGYGHSEVVEILLQRGAKVNLKEKHGLTALMSAASGPPADRTQFETGVAASEKMHTEHLKIAEMLIRHGSKINVRDKRGMTALDHADDMLGSVKPNQRMVDLLLKHGAIRGKRASVGPSD